MRKSLLKLYALLCIVTISISQLGSMISLATTTVTGSALNSSLTASGSALENNQSSPATGSALEDKTTITASRTALINISEKEHELPKIQRVVLPTITDNTYDFTIDIDGLLSQYNSDYVEGDTVYFSSIRRPAQLRVSSPLSNTTTSFVVKSKMPDIDKENFELNILGATENELDFILRQYYVWQINTKSTIANGKWTQLTIDNYDTFFELSMDSEGKVAKILYDKDPLVDINENIWDGEIYTTTYTEISASEAAAQFYHAENPTELMNEINASLYIKFIDKEGNIAYSEATLMPNTSGSVSYQPPIYTHANSSIPAVITNKSTFDISITAEIHITHGDGLTFHETADFANASIHNPNIYMALTNGVHESPVNGTLATASYILKGRNTNAIRYLNLSTDSKGQLIGTYHSYLAPIIAYDSVSFELIATIDNRKASNHAWDSYIDNLTNGIYTRPSIEVIYKFTEVTQDETTPEHYITASGDTYVITDATYNQEDYWVKTYIANAQSESNLLPTIYYSYLVPKKKKS